MPSLSDRLKSVQPNKANRNACVTCQFLEHVAADTRDLITEWLEADNSVAQLHEILTAPSDDTPSLQISMTGFRFHLKHHAERWPKRG